ncbi:MAG: DMT family transporter [Actinomycetia bacterium]|nr:DMT family transporter [Actinomycetes bacterium]
MPGAPTTEEPTSTTGLIGAAVAVTVWGLSGVVAKNIDMGGIAIAAYRFTLYAIVMSAVGWRSGIRLTPKVLKGTIWGGIALGLDVALFFSAVKLTTIVNATIIGAMQPVVVSIVAAKVFGEHITRRDLVLGLIALAGVAVVVTGSTEAPEWNLAGDLAAVGALVAWSAYFVANRLAKDKVTPREYTLGSAFYTGIINIPLALCFGQSLANPSTESWMWLIALAFGSGVLGHELMNWSLRRIPLWLGSTFTLLVPIVSSSAAWIFLDEPLNPIQIAAMILVLGALGLVIAGQSGALKKPRPLRR